MNEVSNPAVERFLFERKKSPPKVALLFLVSTLGGALHYMAGQGVLRIGSILIISIGSGAVSYTHL